MNENEPELSGGSGTRIEDLQNEMQSLRLMMSLALILLIVSGFCVDFYLLRQTSQAGREVFLLRQKADQLAAVFNSAKANEFWNRLSAYSKTHPDFAPIYANYAPYLSQTTLGSANPVKK